MGSGTVVLGQCLLDPYRHTYNTIYGIDIGSIGRLYACLTECLTETYSICINFDDLVYVNRSIFIALFVYTGGLNWNTRIMNLCVIMERFTMSDVEWVGPIPLPDTSLDCFLINTSLSIPNLWTRPLVKVTHLHLRQHWLYIIQTVCVLYLLSYTTSKMCTFLVLMMTQISESGIFS